MDLKSGWASPERSSTQLHSEAMASAVLAEDALVSFAEAVPVLIAYVSPDGCLHFANKACDGWFGLTREQLCGRSLRDLVEPSFQEAVEDHLDTALAGNAVPFEMVAPVNGSRRTMRMTLVPDHNEAREVRGLFLVGEDLRVRFESHDSRPRRRTRSMTEAA